MQKVRLLHGREKLSCKSGLYLRKQKDVRYYVAIQDNTLRIEEGMGPDREIERVTMALQYSRQKRIKIGHANSAGGLIDLGDAPVSEAINQSNALDAMNKRVREEKRQRDVDCVTRETTFREHCHPLTLLRKVKLADGTDGQEIIGNADADICCRRHALHDEVEGTGGVASLGTTVNDPENVLHLKKDRAKEKLQALSWDTETRPYPQLMSAYVGILRGQRVSPQDGDETEPNGVFAARTAPPAAGNRVFDDDHGDDINMGAGF
ncbi:hypothetical protein SARC_12079 [Sphaeroforma arctica JP610]|uniref:Uncharacterized protein n=1 Tax=Sphaeroforma arctica JP610 TaxID=667725 RepID=A0A0L0FG00_9EUKA|nr:hypothetical protein SARC_12079 [Sphaeroforma arctica JP610]KNC75396.1 hypothetical protein SARC_12079 [Sphaeroforma arctica JP610]|eukprot:XP_014149298.1 hypothetical protein SARC_12079 [Sphaeroforma arctica JP610]